MVLNLVERSALKANLGFSRRSAYAVSSVLPWLLAMCFYNGGFFDTLVRYAVMRLHCGLRRAAV